MTTPTGTLEFDEDTLAAAIERGRGLTFEEAIERASLVVSGSSASSHSPAS